MTSKQIKSEITKSLDQVPESVLMELLAYLRQIEKLPAEKVNLISKLKQILAEDRHLLERLAK